MVTERRCTMFSYKDMVVNGIRKIYKKYKNIVS